MQFFIEGALADLTARLRVGQSVRVRVVKSVTEKLSVLRIRGYNLIAEVSSPVLEGDEVTAVVEALEPKIRLRALLSDEWKRAKSSSDEHCVVYHRPKPHAGE